jgi:hypothetical protein
VKKIDARLEFDVHICSVFTVQGYTCGALNKPPPGCCGSGWEGWGLIGDIENNDWEQPSVSSVPPLRVLVSRQCFWSSRAIFFSERSPKTPICRKRSLLALSRRTLTPDSSSLDRIFPAQVVIQPLQALGQLSATGFDQGFPERASSAQPLPPSGTQHTSNEWSR